jgi:amino acid transporter
MEYQNKNYNTRVEEIQVNPDHIREEQDVLVLSTVVDNTEKLKRSITWLDAFWISSGVPALVLFSIGAIAATVGNPSWFVWTISIIIGFLQSFAYAEIAGLFPNKSGGASVYGAIAWIRYGKMLAPISVWCNWFAWSPVLAIGTGLSAGYILSMFDSNALVNTWQFRIVSLNFIKTDLSLRINSTFIIGAILMLVVFVIQHRGILSAARIQMIFAISSLLPLIILGIVPLFIGKLHSKYFIPFAPLMRDATNNVTTRSWDRAGMTLFAGGMFIAAWSTYGFETAVCYTSEFKNPGSDTFKAILSSGLLCLFVFTLIPITFQGTLGLIRMLDPDIYKGIGVAKAMAEMIGAGKVMVNIVVVLLLLSLLLSIMTAMAGSSRTLYQGSVDGWLPKFLSHVNQHGAPTSAMWTDLSFNLVLLLMSDYVFVLAASNVGYIIFIFMNLNAVWIHRMDRPHWKRPFKAPIWLLSIGVILGYVNLVFLGMGSDIWGVGTLITGLAFAALIIPVFLIRHYIQDKGYFPASMTDDINLDDEQSVTGRAGMLPYLALGMGVVVVIVSRLFAKY